MGIGFASWSFLLHLLLVMCAFGNGAREMTENHWESLKDHNHESNHVKMQDSKENIISGYPVDSDGHHKEMDASDDPRADVVPDGIDVLRLHNMDGDHSKDDIDFHKRAHDSLQHAIDDHHRVHAKDTNQGMHGQHLHAYPSAHMNHMDHAVTVFFTVKDLKVGKTMSVYLPKRDYSNSPHLLPREEAESIPFSLKEIPYLLQFFSISEDSPQAKAMKDTLRDCETKPIKGETKFCATSLESMLDFTRSIFGLESHIKVLTTTRLTKSTTVLQNYTILELKEIRAPKLAACHIVSYPYAIFHCHSPPENESKVFKISLGGGGDMVEAIAVCHMDTSQWNPSHVSFRVLGVEPGSCPVCHFFPEGHLVFVPVN